MAAPVLYICILSAHNVAELQAVQLLKPARVIAIVSDFLRREDRSPTLARFAAACATVSPETTVEEAGHGLDGNMLATCTAWVRDRLRARALAPEFEGHRVVVNFTGGTKALTKALFDGLSDVVSAWHYIAFERGLPLLQEVDAAGQAADKRPVDPLPILAQARLYTDRVQVLDATTPTMERAVLERLYDLVSKEGSPYWQWSQPLGSLWFRGSKPKLPGVRTEKERVWLPFETNSGLSARWLIEFAGLPLDGAPVVDGNGVWVPRNTAAPFVRWFAGDWYEQLVGHWLLDLDLQTDDIVANVEVRRPTDDGEATVDPGNEGDLLFRYNGRLRLLEVKAGQQTHILKTAAANKLYTAAQALGMVEAAFLFTPLHGESRASFQAFRDRASALGLGLLAGREDLERWLEPIGRVRQLLLDQADSEDAAPKDPVGPARPLESYLHDIGKYASWSGPDARQRLAEAIDACLADYPDEAFSVGEAHADGRRIGDVLQTAYRVACRFGPDHPEVEALRRVVRSGRLAPKYLLDKQIQRGAQAWSRKRQARERSSQGKALSSVQPRRPRKHAGKAPRTRTPSAPLFEPSGRVPLVPEDLHANDIRGLEPSSSWTLLIDETGTRFETSAAKGPLGRVIGLLVPKKGHGLAPIPKWHAVDEPDLSEIDRVLQAVLDAPVGVLGLSVNALEAASGERWVDGVMLLVDWVVRLLPLDGPTRIEVKVEQRAVHEAGLDWTALANDVRRRLAQAWPARARQVDSLDIELITKSGDGLNGYVDAVAYTWGSPAQHGKVRLHASQLKGTCLWTVDAHQLRGAWDGFARGTRITAETWQQLVRSPDARSSSSLLHTLLSTLADECRATPHLWRTYLAATQRHLDSKAIHLGAVAAELDWLADARPSGSALPAPVDLAWRTARLARANHEGQVPDVEAAELEALREVVYPEDARLVCHADLHLAVAYTNAFQFDLAHACIHPWLERDPAICGRQLHARALSSAGQYAAFERRFADARSLFDTAMASFAALSDGGRLDRSQTGTYRAIAIMDDPGASDSEATDALLDSVELILGHRSLARAMEELASSTHPKDKYVHHTLLRWLVVRGDASHSATYLDRRDRWAQGTGHPWSLIDAYRAMLLRPTDAEFARDLLTDAAHAALAPDNGPIVRLIGATLRVLADDWGADWSGRDATLSQLERMLPAASDAIETLRQPAANDAKRLAAVLPFNFR